MHKKIFVSTNYLAVLGLIMGSTLSRPAVATPDPVHYHHRIELRGMILLWQEANNIIHDRSYR